MSGHEELVQQVKAIQRSGPDGKQAWEEYCVQHLENVRDPNRHYESALQDFIKAYNQGDLAAESGQSGKAELVDQVKGIQRAGPEGREAWMQYCEEYLEGVMDPKRHDVGVLQEFVESYGGPVPPVSRKGGGKGRPQARQYPQAGGGAAVASAPSEAIKSLAKLSTDFRKAWVAYCKQYGEGVNNPADHDEEFLSGFADYIASLVRADMDPKPEAGQKRAVAADDTSEAAAPPAKRKVTIKKAIAQKIQQLNSSGALLAALRLPAVAPSLSQLEEASALDALALLEEQAGEVEDPNEFIKNHVKSLLDTAGEE